MKKTLLSALTLILLISVTILFVNASGNNKEKKTKKAATEMTKCCGKSQSVSACKMSEENTKSCCEAGKSQKLNCEMKDCGQDMKKCPNKSQCSSTANMNECCKAKSESAKKN
jgi:hypothetical protein